MSTSPSCWRALGVVAVLACLGLAACSSDGDAPDGPRPTAFSATHLSCDQDQSSLIAKDTIERVGGLVEDDFVVRHAESTRLGVVALVDRHPAEAYTLLNHTYGVVIVATIDGDGSHAAGFSQVRKLVSSACD